MRKSSVCVEKMPLSSVTIKKIALSPDFLKNFMESGRLKPAMIKNEVVYVNTTWISPLEGRC